MDFFESGKLYAGVNYWASHCGMKMWSNWNESVVDDDFRLLSEAKIKLVRVFPLWSDFQPIEKVYGYGGDVEGFSINGGDTLLDTFDIGLDETMMERFGKLMDIAEKYGIKLIPSILTGWMSGRLFVPPAISDLNLITNPLAIKWEVRFVKGFVKRFKDHPALAAWCLGNECNCMARVNNDEEAWVWTDIIADAIRSQDSEHKVICGMHSQFTPKEKNWCLQSAGENCDYITTHPYASPEYQTERELINTIKPLVHPAAQTVYSSCIAKVPCIIEETGTYGQMYADEEKTAQYANGVIYTAWAHDCLSYLWWIGFDQGSLTYHPFGYNNRASNYGIYREDKTLKPVGEVIKEFNEFSESFEYGKLPKRIVDAICIVTKGQKTWNAAGSSFILGKQVGIDMEFAYANDKLPEANTYLIPSVEGANCFSAEYLAKLMERVNDGATLYLSVGGGFTRNLWKDFGFHIINREYVENTDTVKIGCKKLNVKAAVTYNTEKTTATALAQNQDGKDVFFKAPYGKGTVFFLAYPLETYLYERMHVFENEDYHLFYNEIKKCMKTEKTVSCNNKMIGVTEHKVNENERIIVATNYSKDTSTASMDLNGWKFKKALKGDIAVENTVNLTLNTTETVVFVIEK